MSTGEAAPPAGNEPISASPPEPGAGATAKPPGERIELPPRAATSPVERVDPRRGRRLDAVLCLLLLLLAFLCASFKARNTDLFQSLATGRLVAQGGYAFGVDPFSFASKGTWVNHSWLYDLGTFFLYLADPTGTALVVVKAVLVVALAWLMLRAGVSPGEKLWVPILCTTLGVLAMSPRLLLQSSILSMLMLGVTIFILVRSSERPGRLWLLPPLFLLWVNLDAWFFIGPAAVACYFAGKLVGAKFGREPDPVEGESPGRLGLVLLACLAACLCNPHHVRAFTSLPIGLVQWGGVETFKADNNFWGYFISPWLDSGLYFRDNIGMSVAGVSYFVLLAVSLASFVSVGVYRPHALRPSRLLVWLFFAVLSGLQIRAIPFFAVAAAPLAALNFADLIRSVGGDTASSRQVWDAWAMPGRVFTFLGMAGLCVASISGAVQAQPHWRRELAWGVEVDPGLAGAAKQIAAWRADGVVGPGQNWMTLSPEVVNYLAWFAPGEKGFVDQRLPLFADAGPEYVGLRRSLSGRDAEPDTPPPFAWRKICRDRGVEFLVLHNLDPTRPASMLGGLYSNPTEFVPAYVGGGATIFAWRDPELAGAKPLDPRLVVDFAKRAFGPDDETAPPSPTPVEPYQWWHPFLRADAGPPPEVGSAIQYSTRFESLRQQYQNDQNRAWFGTAGTSLLGVVAAPDGPLAGSLSLPMRMGLLSSYINGKDAGPPDSLYLAIRACRRGLAKNPEDATSHLALAEAYSRLSTSTRERSRTSRPGADGRDQPSFPHARVIRQTQIAAALQAVLKADPTKERAQMAHLMLVRVFDDPQYLESRVMHLKKFLEITRELKRLPIIVPQEGFDEAIKSLEAEVKKADRQLKNKLDQYEVNAGSKRGENAALEKARIALENGLSEKALNLLIEGKAGRTQIVALLLGLGRIDDADQVLTPQPDQEATFDPRSFGLHPLGVPAYEWFQVQKCAAAGDYAGADRHLAEGMKLLRRERAFVEVLNHFDAMSRSIFEREVEQYFARVRLSALVQEASLCTIRAWLALEAGSVGEAVSRSREAMAMGDQLGPNPGIDQMIASRPLARLVQELAREGSR